jgi:SagB-type dehydrogenase family enzyme
MSELQSSARLESVVYADAPTLDDPAEAYHDASKLSPSTAARDLAGAARLAGSPDLRHIVTRATLRHPGLALLPLGPPDELTALLGRTIRARRSESSFGRATLTRGHLAALLEAGYGITGALQDDDGREQPLRAAPSAGALYPLDIYVAVRRVDEITPGLYRFDPLERGLENVGVDPDAIVETTPYPQLVAGAAVSVVLAATFWRSRFKYGQRAYRFALLEAGHVSQNLLLAATALSLAAVPLGGFYDRRLDDALGLDGVNRSAVYIVCIGSRSGS